MADDESIVIRPREFSDDLLLPEHTDELAKFMDEPLSVIAEMITGAMAAGPKSWMVMGGRIVQSILKAKLFQQVSREINELRDKGKIPEDFANEEKYRYGAKSWVELFAARTYLMQIVLTHSKQCFTKSTRSLPQTANVLSITRCFRSPND
jgi:hypothetical protein